MARLTRTATLVLCWLTLAGAVGVQTATGTLASPVLGCKYKGAPGREKHGRYSKAKHEACRQQALEERIARHQLALRIYRERLEKYREERRLERQEHQEKKEPEALLAPEQLTAVETELAEATAEVGAREAELRTVRQEHNERGEPLGLSELGEYLTKISEAKVRVQRLERYLRHHRQPPAA